MDYHPIRSSLRWKLVSDLRINGKRRYRHRNKANRSKLPGRVGIEERPAIVALRKRYFDWRQT